HNYSLSLHDALPIFSEPNVPIIARSTQTFLDRRNRIFQFGDGFVNTARIDLYTQGFAQNGGEAVLSLCRKGTFKDIGVEISRTEDRKSTRLNYSHVS